MEKERKLAEELKQKRENEERIMQLAYDIILPKSKKSALNSPMNAIRNDATSPVTARTGTNKKKLGEFGMNPGEFNRLS